MNIQGNMKRLRNSRPSTAVSAISLGSTVKRIQKKFSHSAKVKSQKQIVTIFDTLKNTEEDTSEEVYRATNIDQRSKVSKGDPEIENDKEDPPFKQGTQDITIRTNKSEIKKNTGNVAKTKDITEGLGVILDINNEITDPNRIHGVEESDKRIKVQEYVTTENTEGENAIHEITALLPIEHEYMSLGRPKQDSWLVSYLNRQRLSDFEENEHEQHTAYAALDDNNVEPSEGRENFILHEINKVVLIVVFICIICGLIILSAGSIRRNQK